ncbi:MULTISPECIES: HAD family hydrolase [unclassified Pedobacter]|uniref:HAD family hydrolase n=1 Tax=unclassified Pedobacter TaxID=2628915 RepID=UPI001E282624|nr:MULTISPECIES: HAD family hydrolase [unclassified Pedobacter]
MELVIFDVDGTLYNQSQLRKKMLFALVSYFLLHPWKINELQILYHFRKEREKKQGLSAPELAEQQYLWCKEKVNKPIDHIKRVVDKWIFNFPNRFLKECSYPGINLFFETLAQKNIQIAIYSDYDSLNKLKAMDLKADLLVSSTDSNINAMKPNSAGLNFIKSKFNINDTSRCLFFGDRKELDGKCAENANVPFFLVEKEAASTSLYKHLAKKLLNP